MLTPPSQSDCPFGIPYRLFLLIIVVLLPLRCIADAWDKKTTITLSEPCRIGSTRLAPGRYVLRIFESSSTRNIVQVLEEDETTVLATIIAVPTFRLQPSDSTRFVFGEAPIGQPLPIRAWFYPGDTMGQEFIDDDVPIPAPPYVARIASRPPLYSEPADQAPIHDKYALAVVY